MGGTIEVESNLGEGTTFTLTFPIEILDQDEVEKQKEETKEERTDQKIREYGLRGKKVLLFEDHPLNAEITARLLEKKGMEVDHAVNGKEGLKIFARSKVGYYDVILMDVRMPVMDGIQATEAIRSLPRRDADKIPIIAMTANAYPEDVARTKEAGMNEHLSKPVDPKELYQVLSRRIEE